MKAVIIYPPAWAPWAPSYAVALLKSAGEARGHSINTFDLNIDFHNAVSQEDRKLWGDEKVLFWETDASVASLVSRYEPFLDLYVESILAVESPLYAFSVNSASYRFACHIADKIKKRDQEAFVLFGGPACFRSETGLDMLRFPTVDAICTGEGDSAWPEFLDTFEKSGCRINGQVVKGFSIRKDDTIVDYGDPDISRDLNLVPFADYNRVDFSKYTLFNRVCLMMSRGCINRCAYCSEGPNFEKYRYREPDNLFAEVKKNVEMLRHDSGTIPHINFSDSLINGKPAVLAEFCDLIIRNGLRFTWGGMALIRKEMTPVFLAKMKRAGCVEICWGLESGSQRVLDLMRKKHFTPQMAEEVFRYAHALGFNQYTNIIVGFPGETEDCFLESAAFLLRIKKYFASIGLPLLSLRKNSYLYNHHRQYGIEIIDTEKWKTIDNSNTYELRVARRNLLQNILQEKFFNQGRYDEANKPRSLTLTALETKNVQKMDSDLEITRLEEQIKTAVARKSNGAKHVFTGAEDGKGFGERTDSSTGKLIDEKIKNIYKYKQLVEALKAGRKLPAVENLPIELYIDLTRRCNLNCIMCSHSLELKSYLNKHSKDALDFPSNRFSIFDDMLPTAAMVYTVGLGEPLLHKGIVEFVSRCRSYGAFVWANSNCLGLTEELARELVNATLSRLVISISAGSKYTYEHYHRGSNWNTFWRNIEFLHSAQLIENRQMPQLFLNYVVMDNNIEELPLLISQSLSFDLAGVSVKPVVNMHGILDSRKNAPVMKNYERSDDNYLEQAREFARVLSFELEDHSYRQNFRSKNKLEGICLHPFSTLMVSTVGDVYPCGQGESVGGPELRLGNIHEQSLMQIWNGEALSSLRSNVINGNYGSGCRECIEKQLCRLHNDQNDPIGGFMSAIEIGCGGPRPNTGNMMTMQEQERLWPTPPPQDLLQGIKKRNFYRYVLSIMRGRTMVFNTPLEIFLETSNACNLRCRFCATQAHETNPSGSSAVMSAGIMESIRSFLPGSAAISLHGFGEPLLNKLMIPAAVRSVEYLLQVDFFTNGMLLNENNARALVSGRVPGFTVSISTANPKKYEKLYERGSFEKLVCNLRFLKEEKQRQGSPYPRIQFNVIAMRDTLPDLPGLVSLAAELGVAAIEVKPLVTYPNLPEMLGQRIIYDAKVDGPILVEAQRIAKQSNLILSASIYEATGQETTMGSFAAPQEDLQAGTSRSTSTRLAKPCPLVYRTMYIRTNGQVKPCCFASDDDQLSLGDVTRQTVHEIWNGKPYQALRKAHQEHNVPPLCAHCVEFNLAPPSDSSQHWLAKSGISVHEPLVIFTRVSQVEEIMSSLKKAVDKWKIISSDELQTDDAIVQLCIEFLTAVNNLLKDLEAARAIFAELNNTTEKMANYAGRFVQAVRACGHLESYHTANRSLCRSFIPLLNSFYELLQACKADLIAGVENVAKKI